VTPPRPAAPLADHIDDTWLRIESLRLAADRQLEVIAAATGQGSRLHRRCRDVWGDWEREALISILNRDHANAEVMLDRGLHVLRHALDLVREGQLSEEDVVILIAAA
jgi:hypothetical protein